MASPIMVRTVVGIGERFQEVWGVQARVWVIIKRVEVLSRTVWSHGHLLFREGYD